MTSWVSALHDQRASPDRLYKNFLWAGEQALNAGGIEKVFATRCCLDIAAHNIHSFYH
jgi:hypothetical protein